MCTIAFLIKENSKAAGQNLFIMYFLPQQRNLPSFAIIKNWLKRRPCNFLSQMHRLLLKSQAGHAKCGYMDTLYKKSSKKRESNF